MKTIDVEVGRYKNKVRVYFLWKRPIMAWLMDGQDIYPENIRELAFEEAKKLI